MPDVLAAHHERRHIALVGDFLAQFYELVIGRRLRPAILVKICLVIDNAVGVLPTERRRIHLTVKCRGRPEKRDDIIRQRLQFAGTYIHRRVSHFHDIRKFSHTVLGLDELAVSAAVTGLDRHRDVRIGLIEFVDDLIHGSLRSLIAVRKYVSQFRRPRDDRLCPCCRIFCSALRRRFLLCFCCRCVICCALRRIRLCICASLRRCAVPAAAASCQNRCHHGARQKRCQ